MRDLRVMARYLSPCRWDFFIAILLLLVECGFEMAIPLLMTGIIDGMIGKLREKFSMTRQEAERVLAAAKKE